MRKVSVFSWNVNGIRAAISKGFINWIEKAQPDILCLQETRISEHQRVKIFEKIPQYHVYWNEAERPGYSGTAILTKIKPQSINVDVNIQGSRNEGRTIIAGYDFGTIINCYFPNGNMGPERLKYKLDFSQEFLEMTKTYKGNTIICADVNTAHKPIDVFNPTQANGRSGFLPEERRFITQLLENGYTDTLRSRYPEKGGLYSWWAYRKGAKENNKGWRFDYIFVSNDLAKNLKDAFIQKNVAASDHAPIGITLDAKN